MSHRQSERQLERALDHLGDPGEAPALGDVLEAELGTLTSVPRRSRRGGFALLGAISILYGVGTLFVVDLRPDLHHLPRLWLALYSLAWLTSFAGIAYLAVVPARGQVAPNWRYAGMASVIAGASFVASGLLFDRHVPGQSVISEPTVDGFLGRGFGCLSMGVLTALVPVFVGALLLRGRLPVGARLAGAGLGAAGGSLGGLVLHLHCRVADGLHLGLIHGGVVVLGAIVGALLLPRTSN
jgi:hypothetical protein